MNRYKQNRILLLAFVGIALRAVIPAGYMPAPVANGLPFVLCHGRFSAAAMFMGAHEHASNDSAQQQSGDSKHEANTWKFCPFGVALGSSVLISDFIPLLISSEHHLAPAQPDYVARSLFTRTYRVRAPPSDHSIDV